MRLSPSPAALGFSNSPGLRNRNGVLFGKAEPHPKLSEMDEDLLLDEALDAFTPAPLLNVPLHVFNAIRLYTQIGLSQSLAAISGVKAAPPEDPAQQRVQKTRLMKFEVADALADWMAVTLSQANVQFAVVARQGGLGLKKHDATGMLHTGIACFHPEQNQWKIYNLVERQLDKKLDPSGKKRPLQWLRPYPPTCEIRWTDPVDFFYQQGGYKKEALLLIPPPGAQAGLKALFESGWYKNLAFTPNYNLVSAPHSKTSLNCNKWTLLMMLAAAKAEADPERLLADIGRNYKPGGLNVSFWQRLFAASDPRVRANEVPWQGPIETVTVESLLKSDLFEHHIFCVEPVNSHRPLFGWSRL
ncbi:DUF2145 domain-containing protein [Vampirovibrio sp.]|uniref:DUF2145 domain-containing protein n=1 Tax=Vampirovibrio sp. TaxID=2717857 RepID=UPI0035933694